MPDLSIIIPGRNEMFMAKTIENALANIRGDTEIISVCDGYWPNPVIQDNPKVNIIHHSQPVGQRAAVNNGVRLSRSKYVMKADAHCAFDEGFDVKLLEEIDEDWTVIPRMYNLHAFDWVCGKCGHRKYQSPTPEKCEKCGHSRAERDIMWKPRRKTRTDFARFDKTMHFQYWRAYEKRPEAAGEITDVMCCVGACWMMSRKRYWELDGMDEAHGSWGQMGVELACKSWLSGGRQVVNKKTWFAHLFRTQGGDFGFPYEIRGRDVEVARNYSRDLWIKDKWPKAKYKIQWLIDKFSPVPDWHSQETV